jgi:hypothetical protein
LFDRTIPSNVTVISSAPSFVVQLIFRASQCKQKDEPALVSAGDGAGSTMPCSVVAAT